MRFLLPIVLLCISQNIFGDEIQQERIDYDDELSHQELKDMNFSCSTHLCQGDTEYPYPVPYSHMPSHTCSCNRQCWEFGTCCIDSPYRFTPPIQKCRNVGITLHDMAYYMIDRCPDKTNTRSILKIHCEKKLNEDDDLFMFTPVTSLDTSRNYKNYYCFKCYETTDNYVLWDLLVDSIGVESETNVSSVFYDEEQKTWMAIYDENPISFPANLSFRFPNNLRAAKPFHCDPDMIRDCPDTWADRRVREKCLASNAFVYQNHSTKYKNIHCALCNKVPLDVLSCFGPTGYAVYFNYFKHMIDLNDKVGNAEKCEKDHAWDPYANKCQTLSCPVPGNVIKNGRCVPP